MRRLFVQSTNTPCGPGYLRYAREHLYIKAVQNISAQYNQHPIRLFIVRAPILIDVIRPAIGIEVIVLPLAVEIINLSIGIQITLWWLYRCCSRLRWGCSRLRWGLSCCLFEFLILWLRQIENNLTRLRTITPQQYW